MDVAVPQDLSIVRENSLVASHALDSMDDDLSPVRATTLPPLMPPDPIQTMVEYRRGDNTSNNLNSIGVATQLALPSTQLSVSGMEVVIRQHEIVGSGGVSTPEMFSSSSSNSSGMILPFNRVQPVAVPTL